MKIFITSSLQKSAILIISEILYSIIDINFPVFFSFKPSSGKGIEINWAIFTILFYFFFIIIKKKILYFINIF